MLAVKKKINKQTTATTTIEKQPKKPFKCERWGCPILRYHDPYQEPILSAKIRTVDSQSDLRILLLL